MNYDILKSLDLLNEKVSEFIHFFQQEITFDFMVYELWSAKDILGHIVFWHESFARNLKDISLGKKPNPLKGKLSEVNKMSVDTTRPVSVSDLIARLETAQKTIATHITNSSIELIPYKRGSRSYSRLEHLQVVEGHISKHLKDLRKVLKRIHAKGVI